MPSANDSDDLPRLARIDPSLFDLLFSGCKVERYAAGQHLFVQEDAADRIYGVMSGTVEISIYSPGGQKLVANIELSRSLVGEIGDVYKRQVPVWRPMLCERRAQGDRKRQGQASWLRDHRIRRADRRRHTQAKTG